MEKIYITYDDYAVYTSELARQVNKAQVNFDQIICLARGGFFLGDAFSRIFNKPLGVMFASSYHCETRGELIIDYTIAKQFNFLGKNILLLDDSVDSGKTVEKVKDFLLNEMKMESVTTAVIWYKPHSIIKPDFYVCETPNDKWFVQPFENFEDFKF